MTKALHSQRVQSFLMAEANGNRTHQRALHPLNGFEDRGAHQSLSYLHTMYQIITENEQIVKYKLSARIIEKISAIMLKKGLLLTRKYRTIKFAWKWRRHGYIGY